MKMPSLLSRKKTLRATTVRRQPMLGLPDDSEYEDMSEPNMKLSRALLIVLVLHVVAIGGVVAFNTIKTRQDTGPQDMPAASATTTAAQSVAAPSNDTPSAVTPAVDNGSAHHEHVVPKNSASLLDRKSEHPKPAEAAPSGPVDSGKTYTVAKGDNPVAIARKLKVPYDDLLALNHIEDPHKLQIGQKLAIPAKQIKPKHSDG